MAQYQQQQAPAQYQQQPYQQQPHQQQAYQQQQAQPAQGGAIDQADINDWTKRFNETLANTATITGPARDDARSWSESFFGCFAPIDLCAITCCLPCVTFGKTHHRSRKDGSMQGYSPINVTCLGFWASSCCALHWIPMVMQRADIRRKYNLQGDFITDLLTSCCCGCCSLIQQEKEVEFREAEMSQKVGYTKTQAMSYP